MAFPTPLVRASLRLLSKGEDDSSEDYPTVKKFRESDNEPLKETFPKVIRAAGRYLELTGGSKVH